MISSVKTLLCLLALLSLCLSQFKKVVHNTDPEALCLDGSPAALLVHQGSQPENILIYLIGAGSCAEQTLEKSLDACVRFTKTSFGSSTSLTDNVDETNFPFFSKIKKNKFAEWTKIIIHQCDGALFQGYNKNPVEHKGNKLYFRGGKIMRAHFKWIHQQYGMAEKVVLFGESSGGVGAFIWADYVRGMVKDAKKFYGVADSGIFLDPSSLAKFGQQSAQILSSFAPNALLTPTGEKQAGGSIKINLDQSAASLGKQHIKGESSSKLPQDSYKQFLALSNADERLPNTNCVETLSDKSEDWRCLFAPKGPLHLDTKMLWLNSQYDFFMIKEIMKIDCLLETGPKVFSPKYCSPPEILIMDYYRGLINTHVLGELAKQGHSIWSNACSWHTVTVLSKIYDNWRVKAPLYGRRRTAKQAVEDFVFKNQKIMDIDRFPWPSNRLCAF